MANKEFNNTIGEKIDQSMREDEIAMLGDLLEMPSQETIDKWAKTADERIYKKGRRKKVLALAAVVAIACISMAMVVKGLPMPNADAGLEKGLEIEDSMEAETIYPSWDKLSDDIKGQFIEFKEFPDGYGVESIKVRESSLFRHIIFKIVNEDEECIYIREGIFNEGALDKNLVISNTKVAFSIGENIFVEKQEDIGNTTYNYKYKNLSIDIVVSNGTDEVLVKEIIEKAIH